MSGEQLWGNRDLERRKRFTGGVGKKEGMKGRAEGKGIEESGIFWLRGD